MHTKTVILTGNFSFGLISLVNLSMIFNIFNFFYKKHVFKVFILGVNVFYIYGLNSTTSLSLSQCTQRKGSLTDTAGPFYCQLNMHFPQPISLLPIHWKLLLPVGTHQLSCPRGDQCMQPVLVLAHLCSNHYLQNVVPFVFGSNKSRTGGRLSNRGFNVCGKCLGNSAGRVSNGKREVPSYI